MKLADKWTTFREKTIPAEAPKQQVLFGQACYLAGAQAAFQILMAASGPDVTREQAILIWGELQQEILSAVGKPREENLVQIPKPQLIV